jgi:retinal rod rhodopsin-sensitive cGMP 3',5'-cyclic phosphodiesterase subunit delta
MLKSKQLARMIVFSSKEPVEKMSLIQKMYLHGQLVETLLFEFGFVIPNSTNSWEQTIVADEGNVMPAEILSGNLTCETLFYSHGVPIHKSSYRIFYDWIKFKL